MSREYLCLVKLVVFLWYFGFGVRRKLEIMCVLVEGIVDKSYLVVRLIVFLFIWYMFCEC